MNPFIPIGPIDAFPLGRGKQVTVGRQQIAIFRLDAGVFAIDNLCLHQAGPLCDGEIDDGAVTCPWHGWSYDLRTGILLQDGRVGVSPHATCIVDGVVHVQLSS
jgi:nitrite reductase/ring-hydroxylating ferredoxin subunit